MIVRRDHPLEPVRAGEVLGVGPDGEGLNLTDPVAGAAEPPPSHSRYRAPPGALPLLNPHHGRASELGSVPPRCPPTEGLDLW